ncbi:MAG: DUF106 domain-containing protein [Nanoarchaeota archaeon]|nr:DUF106 domain-containing protein [Nanoarchaeota archaeon]
MNFIGLVHAYPLVSMILFSFLITLGMTLAYKHFSNQEELKLSKEKTKELQAKMKGEKDQTKLMGYQKEMLEISMNQMKHSMKPMMITFLPIIGIFAGLRYLYAGTPNLMNWSFNVPILCKLLPGVCNGAGWFLSYIIFSMVFSIALRKVLKVH